MEESSVAFFLPFPPLVTHFLLVCFHYRDLSDRRRSWRVETIPDGLPLISELPGPDDG